MVQMKKIAARLAVHGVNALGALLGFGCCLAGIGLLLSPAREDSAFRWFAVGFSAFVLVVGAWLLRDSYRMFRRRSFESIKSVAAILAIVAFSSVVELIERFASTSDRGTEARTFVLVACGVAGLLAAWLVYSLCTKLTNRLLKAAYGPDLPEQPSEASHAAR